MQTALEADLQDTSTARKGPDDLVKRYLPPGTYADLYHLYTAHQLSNQQPVASMRTFRRALQDGPSKNESMSCQLSCHVMSNFMSCHVKFHVMSCHVKQCQDWKKVLKFRPQTTHSECHHCHELKKAIRDAVDLKAHLVAADQLLRHLSGQWADRKVYWTSRSRAKTSRDLLVMMCDGMDKGKYHLPRWSGGRAPKQAESLSRPACEVYACLLHGHMLCVYISDCDQTSGSNFVIEVISRTLDKAFKESQKTSSGWPSALQVWSDNTPKAGLHVSLMRHVS